MSNYAALATVHRRGRVMVGEGEGGGWGDIVSSVLSAAGEMGGKAIQNVQSQEKREAEQKRGANDLAAAVAADRWSTAANAKALVSEAARQPSSDADRQAAGLADQAQDQAGSGLSPENQKKRAEAARGDLAKATAEWQRDPKSAAKKARVTAAQRTLVKAQGAQLAAAAQPGGMPSIVRAGSQWPRRATAAGALGAVGLVLGAALAKNRLAGAIAGLIAGSLLGGGAAYTMEKM